MNKGSHFNGQPAYGQLINLLDKSKILQISQEKGGERYVKHFDAWQHLLIMLVSIRPRACFSPSYNKVKSQTKHVWLLTLL